LRAGSFCVWFDPHTNYNVTPPYIQTIHKHAHRVQCLRVHPRGHHKARNASGKAGVKAICSRTSQLHTMPPRTSTPAASGEQRTATVLKQARRVHVEVPAAFASAIEPVIALPRGSVMLVGKVPSPALSSTRLGLPSFPSSTSRLSSPATSAAAIAPSTAQGRRRWGVRRWRWCRRRWR